MRKDYLIFDDVNTKDFNVGIYGDKLAAPPGRAVEYGTIPGKNGGYIIDKGYYENITVSYRAYIIDKYNNNIRGLRNALLSKVGFFRLEDTVNDEEFRIAQVLPFDIDEVGVLRAGEFALQFYCKPQRFLKSGEAVHEFTAASSALFNEQKTTALPLIRAYGTGYFTINGIKITINSASSYTDIDCELQEAYKDTMATNCNGNIVLDNGEFPKLAPGSNAIVINGLSKLEIKPRWWIL